MSTHRTADTVIEADDTAQQFNPLLILHRYKWLLLFCGIAGAGLGYLHYMRQPKVYESSAMLLVVPEKQNDLQIKDLASSRTQDDGLLTQMILIRSPLVIDKATVDPRLAQLPSIAGSGNPAAVILSGLDVRQAVGPNQVAAKDVLSLSFRGAEPDDCAEVVRVVIAAYQAFLGETRQSMGMETVDLISRAKDSLLEDLRQKESDFREFRKRTQLIWVGSEGKNIHQERVAEVEIARSELILTRAELRARLQAVEQAVASGGNREALTLMVSQLLTMQQRGGDVTVGGNGSISQQLATLAVEEEMLLERVGPRHPKVLAIQKQIEVTRRLASEFAPKSEDDQKVKAPPDIVAAYVGSLRQQLRVLETQESELNSLFTQERELAREMDDVETEYATFQMDISRTQHLFDGVVKRLEEISLIKDVGGTYTQIISEPGTGIQVLPRFTTTIAAAVLIGLALGFGCGTALELTNRDFRSYDEIARQTGLPIIGQFPQLTVPETPVEDSNVDRMIFAYHQPKSSISEAYRAVRTYVYFSTYESGQARRVVLQVTSPLPGDGKTTLTANLAVTMAQSGKRVLFIEADLRRPRAAKLFGVSAEAGLVAAINGEREIDDCVHATEVPSLWLMPVGTRPSNPSELLSSPQFRQLLEVVREKYDLVMIDSPPLLPVTDATVIAAACDGVVLLLRVRADMRSAALASLTKLRSVGAKVLGTVVRGEFERRPGAGGYGYGNGYGYRYNYEYAESYDEDHDAEALTVSS